MLIDYGCGAGLSNERLLLEYGFVLRELSDDSLALPFGAIAVGLAAVAEAEDEDEDELGEEAAALLGVEQQRLLAQLGDVEEAGLRFEADGAPHDALTAHAPRSPPRVPPPPRPPFPPPASQGRRATPPSRLPSCSVRAAPPSSPASRHPPSSWPRRARRRAKRAGQRYAAPPDARAARSARWPRRRSRRSAARWMLQGPGRARPASTQRRASMRRRGETFWSMQ